jgi:hypothetical protein
MVCLVSFLFAGPALAQQSQPQTQPSDAPGVTAPQPEQPKMGKGACKADIEQFCKDAEKGKVGACLRQHKDELSADCKASMKARVKNRIMAARQAAKDACKDDVEQFCKGVEKGQIGACLKQHKDELSADCKASRKKIHRMREKMAEKAQENAPALPAAQPPAQQ